MDATIWSIPGRPLRLHTRCFSAYLFTFLWCLFSFTDLVLAQEVKIHSRRWTIPFPKRNVHDREPAEDDFGIPEIAMDPLPGQGDGFIDDGNSTRTHEHNLVRGIAQDLYHDLNERNFMESKSLDYFEEWSVEARDRFEKEKQSRPELTLFSFFPEDVLGWKGMHCSLDLEEGCINAPSPDDVRKQLPTEHFRARQISFIIHALQLAHTQVDLLIKVVHAVGKRMDGLCDEFTHTFFHEATHHPKKMCAGQIANIIVSIVMALLTIWTLGSAIGGFVGQLMAEGMMEGFAAAGEMMAEAAAEAGTEAAAETAAEGAAEAGSSSATIAAKAAAELAGEVTSDATMDISGGSFDIAQAFADIREALPPLPNVDGPPELPPTPELVDPPSFPATPDLPELPESPSYPSGPETPEPPIDPAADPLPPDGPSVPPEAGPPPHPASEPPVPRFPRIQRLPPLRIPRLPNFPYTRPYPGINVSPMTRYNLALRKIWYSVSEFLEMKNIQGFLRNKVLFHPSRLYNDMIVKVVRDLLDQVVNIDEHVWRSIHKIAHWTLSHAAEDAAEEFMALLRAGRELGPFTYDPITEPSIFPRPPAAVAQPVKTSVSWSSRFKQWFTALKAAVQKVWKQTVNKIGGPKRPPAWMDGAMDETADAATKHSMLGSFDSFDFGAQFGGIFPSMVASQAIGRVVMPSEDESVKQSNSPRMPLSVVQFNSTPFIKQHSQDSESRGWRQVAASAATYNFARLTPVDNTSSISSSKGASGIGGELTVGMAALGAMNGSGHGQAGAFVQIEWFPVQDLESAPEDGSSLYDLLEIAATSVFVTDPAVAVTEMYRKNYTARFGSSQGPFAVRSTSRFTIRPINDTATDADVKIDPRRDLGSRILSRLQREDGSSMDLNDALSFMSRNAPDIQEHYEALRRSDIQIIDTNVQLPSNPSEPKFRVNSHNGQLGWHDILGGVDFAGIKPKGEMKKEVGEMRWRTAKPKVDKSNSDGPQKRSVRSAIKSHPAAAHHIMGIAKSMEGLGLIAPRRHGRKRSEGWSLARDEDIWTMDFDDRHFKNDIKHQECSIDNYTGDQTHNRETCHDIVKEIVETLEARLRRTVGGLDNIRDWVRGGPAPLTLKMQNRFHSFASVTNAHRLQSNRIMYENKMLNNLKNSMVSKAYADENCYIRCARDRASRHYGHHRHYQDEELHQFQDAVCRATCFDITEMRLEGLYGLDPQKSLKAERDPWKLNETTIVELSYAAYQSHAPEAFLPGSFNLEPFGNYLKDHSPILPVCMSEYHSVSSSRKDAKIRSSYPCTCGNKYGDESLRFWAASNWAGTGDKHNAYHMLYDCLHDSHLESLSVSSPAAYLVNMCQVVYHAVAPIGRETPQETHNKGHYFTNYHMCMNVLDFYEENKEQDDSWLDNQICSIWSRQATDWHRGNNHKHPDISYVNSALNHGGCHGYR